MKKQIVLGLFIAFSILLCSCGTIFYGANSLDCKIDGDKYKPTDVTSSTTNDYVILSSLNQSENFTITIPINIAPGDYDLENNTQITLKYTDYNRKSYYASSGTFSVTTVDNDKQQIFGEFDLYMFSSVTGETLHITDGDFKVSF